MIFFISVLINADDLYLGGIAQLVEHLLCKQGVNGSNPLFSTPKEKVGMKYFTFLPFYPFTFKRSLTY